MADGGGHLPASPQPKARSGSTKTTPSNTSLPSSYLVLVLLRSFGARARVVKRGFYRQNTTSKGQVTFLCDLSNHRTNWFHQRWLYWQCKHVLLEAVRVDAPMPSLFRRRLLLPALLEVCCFLLALVMLALLVVWSLLPQPQMVGTGR